MRAPRQLRLTWPVVGLRGKSSSHVEARAANRAGEISDFGTTKAIAPTKSAPDRSQALATAEVWDKSSDMLEPSSLVLTPAVKHLTSLLMYLS